MQLKKQIKSYRELTDEELLEMEASPSFGKILGSVRIILLKVLSQHLMGNTITSGESYPRRSEDDTVVCRAVCPCSVSLVCLSYWDKKLSKSQHN